MGWTFRRRTWWRVRLRLGTSYMYAPGKIVDLSFGVGLTPDTPNLQFSVGVPFRTSIWGPKLRSCPTSSERMGPQAVGLAKTE